MKSVNKTILAISVVLTLVACGGGGGGSATTNTSTTPTTGENTNSSNTNTGSANTGNTTGSESTGSVVEKLDTSKTYRVIFDYPNSSGSSNISDVKQNDQGVITEFSSYQLSGTVVGKEIAGNKNFAIARIAKGLITYQSLNQETKTTLVENYTNGSYYYFASLPLAQKIASETIKQIQCTDINATQAKVTNAKGSYKFVSPTISNGSITLNTDGSIGVKFTAKIGSDETTYTSQQLWIEKNNSYNGYNLLGIEGQQGQSNQIGTFNLGYNGENSLVFGSIYRITTNNGAAYQGAVSMICNI